MTTPPVTLVRWQVMLLLILTFAVAASGLSLVKAAQQMRSLHSALDVLQSAQDRQMAEYVVFYWSAARLRAYKPSRWWPLKSSR